MKFFLNLGQIPSTLFLNGIIILELGNAGHPHKMILIRKCTTNSDKGLTLLVDSRYIESLEHGWLQSRLEMWLGGLRLENWLSRTRLLILLEVICAEWACWVWWFSSFCHNEAISNAIGFIAAQVESIWREYWAIDIKKQTYKLLENEEFRQTDSIRENNLREVASNCLEFINFGLSHNPASIETQHEGQNTPPTFWMIGGEKKNFDLGKCCILGVHDRILQRLPSSFAPLQKNNSQNGRLRRMIVRNSERRPPWWHVL